MSNSIEFKLKHGLVAAGVLCIGVLLFGSVSVNDGGYRTVVQYPTGTMEVKFAEGWYLAPFAKETVYPNVVSYDLENGIAVRYQDGGKGTIDGTVRAQLPNDEVSMLKLHREFLSEEGLVNKLFIPEIRQALNQTAGLLTSEEAYAEKRSNIAEWSEAIMENGRFVTKVTSREVVMTDGTKQRKNVPEIVYDGATPKHQGSPFREYGLNVSGFQVTTIDFEDATQKQINAKRDAEMGSITARANADRALWEKKEVEAKGEKEVAARRYEELQIKERALIVAQREKEVAVIGAQKQKEVNEQQLLAAEIDVKTAKQQAAATVERANAEAKAKELIMNADGALDKKLATIEAVNKLWADAYQRRQVQDVPSIMLGGGANGVPSGSAASSSFMQMMEAKLARDLAVDLKINK